MNNLATALSAFAFRAITAAPLLILIFAIGCGRPAGKLSIVSYADPYFPETIRTDMSKAFYRIDAAGDIHIACHSDVDTANGSGATAWLHAHIYWHPKPGKTHDDPTSADATVRYLVLTANGARLYTGSAFVFPQIDRSGVLTARIENARLQPVAANGQAPTSLGESKLSGVLKAMEDRSATVDLAGELGRIASQLQTSGESP